jgi:AraC-like DNA-binding protein
LTLVCNTRMSEHETRKKFFDEEIPHDQWLELLKLLPDVSFFLKNRAGQFIGLNQKGCDYCKVSSDSEAIGKTDFDFFPKTRAAAYVADDQEVMNLGIPITNRIECAPEHQGSSRLVMTSKLPLRNSSGDVIGVAGFSREIHEIRQTMDSLDRFAQVAEHIHKHFETAIKTAQLAKIAGLSPSQFERRFQATFGTTARQYLLRVRVEEAARLLRTTDSTVTEIALDCGFHDHSHLNRNFCRIMNVTPTEFRDQRSINASPPLDLLKTN